MLETRRMVVVYVLFSAATVPTWMRGTGADLSTVIWIPAVLAGILIATIVRYFAARASSNEKLPKEAGVVFLGDWITFALMVVSVGWWLTLAKWLVVALGRLQ